MVARAGGWAVDLYLQPIHCSFVPTTYRPGSTRTTRPGDRHAASIPVVIVPFGRMLLACPRGLRICTILVRNQANRGAVCVSEWSRGVSKKGRLRPKRMCFSTSWDVDVANSFLSRC